jgi:hypothetical protein
MTDLDVTGTGTTTSRPPRAVVIATAVAAAVVANLVIYGIGRAAGGDFEFTKDGQVMGVDAVTVAGFSAVPLGLGLILVALLSRSRWIVTLASILAPLLAVLTIGVMTIPVDLDTTSTIALAACHLTLVPISILSIHQLRR